MTIDDLDQDLSLKHFARQAAEELKRNLSSAPMFQLPEEVDRDKMLATGGIVDVLAYGRAVDAQAVLSGSVRRTGGHLRLVVRLLRCDTGDVLWWHTENLAANQVSRELPLAAVRMLSDLKARWRTRIADFIHPAVHVPLPDAQPYYARAMELSTRPNHDSMNEAVALFRRAVEADPQFASARGMLAYAFWVEANTYGEWDRIPLAVSAAHDALKLDSHNQQARRVLVDCALCTGRVDEALETFWNVVQDTAIRRCLRRSGHRLANDGASRAGASVDISRGETGAGPWSESCDLGRDADLLWT